MKRVNILFLMLSLDVGGTEKHIYNLVSNLNIEKYNPVICCIRDRGLFGDMLVEKGFKVYQHVVMKRLDIHGIRKLIAIIKNENIDILFTASYPLTQFWGTITAKLTGIKATITRVGGTQIVSNAKRRMIINKICFPFVTRVIAQAYSHKDYLVKFERVESGKIDVICNSIDLEQFDQSTDKSISREKLGVPEGAPVIGIVGRLAKVKGHTMFLEGAKKIINTFPDARFLIVGDGEERENLEERARALGIQSNIHFLGTITDIPQVISLFDIAVLTSKGEAVPNAILEYMAASKPVVATDVGSIAEVMADGETGFLIPYGEPDALADAVLKLLNDRELAGKMGEKGRKRTEEKFALPEMIEKYESLFQELAV